MYTAHETSLMCRLFIPVTNLSVPSSHWPGEKTQLESYWRRCLLQRRCCLWRKHALLLKSVFSTGPPFIFPLLSPSQHPSTVGMEPVPVLTSFGPGPEVADLPLTHTHTLLPPRLCSYPDPCWLQLPIHFRFKFSLCSRRQACTWSHPDISAIQKSPVPN